MVAPMLKTISTHADASDDAGRSSSMLVGGGGGTGTCIAFSEDGGVGCVHATSDPLLLAAVACSGE